MKAVILAAGVSSRLRELCGDRPKCLLEVAGVPILRRLLDHLAACGIDHVTIVAGFAERHIRRAIGTWGAPAHIAVNEQYASTNNAFSLLQVRESVDGEPFVLLDSDIVFERDVLRRLLASPHANRLALRPASDLGDEEIKCRLDSDGRVLEIGKHVPVGESAGESVGIECFSREASERLFRVLSRRMADAALRNEFYEATFQELIEDGVALHAVPTGQLRCAEIDTPHDLMSADALMRDGAGT